MEANELKDAKRVALLAAKECVEVGSKGPRPSKLGVMLFDFAHIKDGNEGSSVDALKYEIEKASGLGRRFASILR